MSTLRYSLLFITTGFGSQPALCHVKDRPSVKHTAVRQKPEARSQKPEAILAWPLLYHSLGPNHLHLVSATACFPFTHACVATAAVDAGSVA